MAKRKSKTNPVHIILIVLASIVAILLGVFMPSNWFESPVLGIAVYVLVIRVVMVGFALKNINYYTGNQHPPILAFIPWLQCIILTDSKIEKILYVGLPFLAIAVFFGGTSTPVLSLLTFENVESVFTIVQYISLAIVAVWRLIYAKINGTILYQAHEILNDRYQAPDTGISGAFQAMSTVWMYVSCLSYALPLISLIGHLSLLLESNRLAGIKHQEVMSKKRKATGIV